MAKKISWAKIHGELFVPGIGNMKSTLPPDNKTFKGGFSMTFDVEGLRCKAGAIEFLIPSASVQLAVVEPEKAAPATPAPDKKSGS